MVQDKSLSIDLLSPKMRYRLKHASLRKEALAKAMGFKPRDNPKIIDATGGLGRDSFMLAALGFKVTLLERSPVLFALLKEALKQATQEEAFVPIANRLHLIEADAIHWLQKHAKSEQPDIIYLDPMFPERQKSAAVKKEMRLLQEIVGEDQDAAELFAIALTCARKRVVVKRPRLAENIANKTPTYSIMGKSSRFDIYVV